MSACTVFFVITAWEVKERMEEYAPSIVCFRFFRDA